MCVPTGAETLFLALQRLKRRCVPMKRQQRHGGQQQRQQLQRQYDNGKMRRQPQQDSLQRLKSRREQQDRRRRLKVLLPGEGKGKQQPRQSQQNGSEMRRQHNWLQQPCDQGNCSLVDCRQESPRQNFGPGQMKPGREL